MTTRTAPLAMMALVLAGCATLEEGHGYVPDDALLAEVMPGVDTKTTVGRLIGQPGSTGLVDDDAWYYVASDYERFLWRAPVEVDREVVAVSFDDRARVTNIERFGLERGRVVVLSRRVTDADVKGIGFIRQLFGNFGNIDPGSFVEQ